MKKLWKNQLRNSGKPFYAGGKDAIVHNSTTDVVEYSEVDMWNFGAPVKGARRTVRRSQFEREFPDELEWPDV